MKINQLVGILHLHGARVGVTEVKPISSHTYEGKHHVAEIQVEGVLDGDGLRKLTEVSGVPGLRCLDFEGHAIACVDGLASVGS